MSGSTGVSVSTNGNTTTYTAANGTTYAVTQNYVLGIPVGNSTVVISYPSDSGMNPYTVGGLFGLPHGNIYSTQGGPTVNLANGLFKTNYVVLPGASTNFNIPLAIGGGNNFYIGGTAEITSGVALGANLTLNIDGGTATATSGSIAGAFSGVIVNLTDGGTFTNGTGLLSVLNGSTINFGGGGGTFVANVGASTGLFDLSKVTINNFKASNCNIEFKGLNATLTSYKISTASTSGFPFNNITSQLIQLYGAGSTTPIGSVVVQGDSLPNGSYSAGSGPLSDSQSGGGMKISIAAPVTAPCFLGQTMIATPEGEKAVSELTIGDMVLSKDGVAMPVRWIGRRKVSTMFADPLRALPVRIQAGALGDGLPKRDLLISPDHALLLDGVLANAGALVNGQTITREEIKEESFIYYHIEVDDHALILAEGSPAETFIDHVERMAFDNWAEHQAIFGDVCDKPEMEYPRAKSARQLPQSLKARLGARQAA